MNAKTLKALNGSIEHWRRIAAGEEGEQSTTNCPLCQAFNAEESCTDCPAEKRPGGLCYDTPYGEWDYHQVTKHREKYEDPEGCMVRCSVCKELALKEVAFLESLLPKTKKARK
jgi:hypothetical protein